HPMKTSLSSPGRRSRLPASRRGSALYLVLILGVVASVTLAGLISFVAQSSKIEKRSNERLESPYPPQYPPANPYHNLQPLVNQSSANLPTLGQTSGVTNLGTAPTGVFTSALGYTWKAHLTTPVENGAPTWAHSSYNPSQGSYQFLSVVEFTRTLPTGGAV